MARYQGHRSWNAWNVCLYLSNDYNTYQHCLELIRRYGVEGAARRLTAELKGQRTPDGAVYNLTCIREALRGMKGATS